MMRDSGNKSVIFGAFGLLLIAAGVALIVIGKNIYSQFYAQVEYFYQHNAIDPTGKHIMAGGIVAALLGGVLLAISLYYVILSRRDFSRTLHSGSYDEVDDVMEQLAGNKTIFDIFSSEDHHKTFSFYRNKTCILKEGEEVHRGKMEPLTWAAGHPTLWRITMDYGGREESCEISKVEGNILVKGAGGEEIFYRN